MDDPDVNLPIRWLAQAAAELAHEVGRVHGSKGHEDAEKFLHAVNKQVGLLAAYPHSGRPGRVEGTRELLTHDRKWILLYRVLADVEVQILAFVSSRRDVDKALRERE